MVYRRMDSIPTFGNMVPWTPPKDLFVAERDRAFRESLEADIKLRGPIPFYDPMKATKNPFNSLAGPAGRAKRQAAASAWSLEPGEEAAALIDLTAFGTASNHILITSRAVRVRSQNSRFALTLEQLKSSRIEVKDSRFSFPTKVTVENQTISLKQSDVSPDDFAHYLQMLAGNLNRRLRLPSLARSEFDVLGCRYQSTLALDVP